HSHAFDVAARRLDLKHGRVSRHARKALALIDASQLGAGADQRRQRPPGHFPRPSGRASRSTSNNSARSRAVMVTAYSDCGDIGETSPAKWAAGQPHDPVRACSTVGPSSSSVDMVRCGHEKTKV